MIKNYFFLSRIGYELCRKIKGKNILESYSSKKDTLFINLSNGETNSLEICVNHSLPFINLKELSSRKKRNSVTIFPEIINLKFSDLFIAKKDRVLLFQIENEISLFYAIRGKYTNLYLLNTKEFLSFKKIVPEDLAKIRDKFLSLEFVSPLTFPDFSDDDKNLNISEIKKKYPFLSNEIVSRINDNSSSPVDLITNEIKNIFYKDFYLVNDFKNRTTEINFSPQQNDKSINTEKYSTALELSAKYLQMLRYFDVFNKLYNHTLKHTEKESAYLNNKKKNITARLEIGSKETEFKKIAEILLINKHFITTGLNEIVVNDVFDKNKPITIKLNKKFTPQENIEYYFNKAKEERLFFQRSQKILVDIDNKLKILDTALNELNQCQSLNELLLVMKNIGLKVKTTTSEQNEPKLKFRQFIIGNKFSVFVGKDSKSNDLLTLQFAKPNDYWFHARSVSGSHVVLRIENKSEVIPKNILNKVASIAAFFSKAKNSSLASVSYTQKKYVIKKKGMNVGQVALLKENTLLVKPEIPEDAVPVEQ